MRSLLKIPLLSLLLLVSFHLVFVFAVAMGVLHHRWGIGARVGHVLLGTAYLFTLVSGVVLCNVTIVSYRDRAHLRIWLAFVLVHLSTLVLCGLVLWLASLARAPDITVAPVGRLVIFPAYPPC